MELFIFNNLTSKKILFSFLLIFSAYPDGTLNEFCGSKSSKKRNCYQGGNYCLEETDSWISEGTEEKEVSYNLHRNPIDCLVYQRN